MAQAPGIITGASFEAAPPTGTPYDVQTRSLGSFPRDGSTYAILTSGDATLADTPNSSEGSGADVAGPNVRGDTDFDVTILKVDLDVPFGSNCLSVDFRFLSDEFPEFVGSSFNDAFIAELDTSDWTTAGSEITAPHNFAFDAAHNVISINAAGAASMSAVEAAGTTYDGATPLLSASTPISPGAHSLYLSIFDQGDHPATRRSSSTGSGSGRPPGTRASRVRLSSRLRRRRTAGRRSPAARTATRSRSRTRAPSPQR